MDLALVLTLTLPGVALLLVAVAVAEQVAARLGRRGPVSRRRRHALSAAGLDVFSVALAPGREADLEEHQVREMTREDPGDGAPPRPRNLGDTLLTSGLPTVGRAPLKAVIRTERGTPVHATVVEQATWTCPNCTQETRAPRKRCRDCGTSRF